MLGCDEVSRLKRKKICLYYMGVDHVKLTVTLLWQV